MMAEETEVEPGLPESGLPEPLDGLVVKGKPVEPAEMAVGDMRHHEAYRLRMKGMPIKQIAGIFRVSERTIHRWLRAYEQEFRESIEAIPAMNLIAQQLCELYALRDTALRDYHNVVNSRDKSAFMRCALKAQELIIGLMVQTGVMPKEPDKLYVAAERAKPSVEVKADAERSRDEIEQTVIGIISRMKRTTPH